jgi:hypothetical protein
VGVVALGVFVVPVSPVGNKPGGWGFIFLGWDIFPTFPVFRRVWGGGGGREGHRGWRLGGLRWGGQIETYAGQTDQGDEGDQTLNVTNGE